MALNETARGRSHNDLNRTEINSEPNIELVWTAKTVLRDRSEGLFTLASVLAQSAKCVWTAKNDSRPIRGQGRN